MVMSMSAENNICHICNLCCPEGVRLVAGYICAECLIQISCTDVEDPKYAFYVAKLKELWQAG